MRAFKPRQTAEGTWTVAVETRSRWGDWMEGRKYLRRWLEENMEYRDSYVIRLDHVVFYEYDEAALFYLRFA